VTRPSATFGIDPEHVDQLAEVAAADAIEHAELGGECGTRVERAVLRQREDLVGIAERDLIEDQGMHEPPGVGSESGRTKWGRSALHARATRSSLA
jgi:hypothetical protein